MAGRRLILNLTAGFAATAWSLGIGLLAVPVYLRLLGAQGYALIALHMTLQAVLQALDGGLTATATREVAARGGTSETARLLRAMAWIGWSFAAIIALALWGSARWLAAAWLQVDPARQAEVTAALGLMGLALGLRWPAGFYQAILYGADQQARVSQVQIAGSLLAHGGGICVLWWGGPSLPHYFGWQIFAVGLQVLVLRIAAAPHGSEHPGVAPWWPDLASLRRIQRFSAGMTALGLAGLALATLDKLILSKLLPLGTLGHYMLASTVAGLTYALATPVFHWAYPALTRQAAQCAVGQVAAYRQISHLLACLLAPVLVLLVAGGEALLLLWTRDESIAQGAATVVGWLATGCVLHAATYPSHALTLALGRPGLALRLNLVLLALAVPLLATLAHALGPAGAGMAWTGIHALYIGPGCWITHRLLMPQVARDWLLRDVGPALVLAVIVAWAGRALVPPGAAGLGLALMLAGMTLAALAVVSPRLRATLRQILLVARRLRS